ncbi:MAG: MATE family efflux transporter [Myxococcales bacterium]
MVHDMTQGSIRGHVLRMVSFVFAGLAIQTLYSLVDIFWVGRLGERAVAAVALSTNLMFLSLALTQTLSVGCVALVSQAAGRKDAQAVQRLFNQAQSLSVCAGLAFFAGSLAFMGVYTERLSGDAQTAQLAREFLVYFIPSMALQFTMVGLASALRGIGDMKPGLVAQTLSVLFNMILAPFLIFGWFGTKPLGVAGAALSTLVATLAAVIGLSVYLARGGSSLRVSFADWRPDFSVWRRMLSIGLPAGTEFVFISLNMGVIYAAMKKFGPEAQAGFGIGSRVMQAGFMPAVAISFSVAAVVGQNFGAGAYPRVREAYRESAKLTVVLMLLFTLVCQVVPAPMVRAFTADAGSIEVGADYLRSISLMYVASGLVFVIAGIFQGIGNTWPSLACSAVRCLLFVGPVAALMVHGDFEIHTIWILSVASVFVQLGLCLYLLRRELAIKVPLTAPATAASDQSAYLTEQP